MIPFQIVLIAHLFGLALGMGGAITFDAIFLIASRRGRITRELVQVVHAASGLIAAAMLLLVVSGLSFFAVGAETSPKFWAKMVIVTVACLNGLLAHHVIFPIIDRASASGTGQLHLRPGTARFAAASAAVSGVSWSGALVLGAWHGLRLNFGSILGVYVCLIAVAILFAAFIIAPRIFVFVPSTTWLGSSGNRCDSRAVAALTLANMAVNFANRIEKTGDWEVVTGGGQATLGAQGIQRLASSGDRGKRSRSDWSQPWQQSAEFHKPGTMLAWNDHTDESNNATDW